MFVERLGRGNEEEGLARGTLVLRRRRRAPKGNWRRRRFRAGIGDGNSRPAQQLLLSPLVRHFSDRLTALRQKLLAGRLAGFCHVKLPSRWMKLHEANTNLCEGG